MEINLNYRLIGQRIKAIRKKRGMTQEQLAELADISPQHCSGIETGGAKVSLPALVRLCNALDATPDQVLMDNLRQSTPLYLKDVAEVFVDASPDELYLMLSQAENIKKAVRIKGLLAGKEKSYDI